MKYGDGGEARKDRISTLYTASERDRIVLAAVSERSSLSSFVRRAALAEAERVLRESEGRNG